MVDIFLLTAVAINEYYNSIAGRICQQFFSISFKIFSALFPREAGVGKIMNIVHFSLFSEIVFDYNSRE